MEHVIPPRDLRSWQNLPISAVANFKPVNLDNQSESALKKLLEHHPYRHFPVVEGQRLKGIAVRTEIESALSEHRLPRLEVALTCRPGDSIRDSQDLLIESTTGTVILSDQPEGRPLGIVTLHDVLRAQIAISERETQ